jgi:hypothetical protein
VVKGASNQADASALALANVQIAQMNLTTFEVFADQTSGQTTVDVEATGGGTKDIVIHGNNDVCVVDPGLPGLIDAKIDRLTSSKKIRHRNSLGGGCVGLSSSVKVNGQQFDKDSFDGPTTWREDALTYYNRRVWDDAHKVSTLAAQPSLQTAITNDVGASGGLVPGPAAVLRIIDGTYTIQQGGPEVQVASDRGIGPNAGQLWSVYRPTLADPTSHNSDDRIVSIGGLGPNGESAFWTADDICTQCVDDVATIAGALSDPPGPPPPLPALPPPPPNCTCPNQRALLAATRVGINGQNAAGRIEYLPVNINLRALERAFNSGAAGELGSLVTGRELIVHIQSSGLHARGGSSSTSGNGGANVGVPQPARFNSNENFGLPNWLCNGGDGASISGSGFNRPKCDNHIPVPSPANRNPDVDAVRLFNGENFGSGRLERLTIVTDMPLIIRGDLNRTGGGNKVRIAIIAKQILVQRTDRDDTDYHWGSGANAGSTGGIEIEAAIITKSRDGRVSTAFSNMGANFVKLTGSLAIANADASLSDNPIGGIEIRAEKHLRDDPPPGFPKVTVVTSVSRVR